MKRANTEEGSNSIDKILQLPQGIPQRILYFLSQEEAIQTSVLSKSWRHIWCSRPNLDFSETSFKGNKQEFLFTVDKNLQRYFDQRLPLDEFHLSLWIGDSDRRSISLLEKWIPRFRSMSIKEFHLSVISNQYIDTSLLVFKPEYLKVLYLENIKLGLKNIPDQKMPFVRLEELRLCGVWIKKEIFDTIISSCPLLITMFFEECKRLKSIKLETKLHKYLKHFTFINTRTHAADECSIEIEIPTIETIEIAGSKIRFYGHEFSNLKSLTLQKVEISADSFDNSSCYHFPNLRVFNMSRCPGFPQFQLRIDAPNIKYFKCEGEFVPSISFTPTSTKWRSDINLLVLDNLDDVPSWLLKVSELLHGLSQSEISMSIDLSRWIIQQDILVQDNIINGGNKRVVVEYLHLSCNISSSVPSFLNGLFCICRPRNIASLCLSAKFGYCDTEREQKRLTELLCKILTKRSLRIERFDECGEEWQPLQGKTLLECGLQNISSVHFRLKSSTEACGSSSKPFQS